MIALHARSRHELYTHGVAESILSNHRPKKTFVLSVDVGTTSVKLGCVDTSGELLWWDRERILAHQHDSTRWYPKTWVRVLQIMLDRMPRTLLETLSAVAVSGHGPTVIPLDHDGEPLSHALMWLETHESEPVAGESYFLPKVAWFRSAHPRLFESTRYFLSCPEFVSFFLTGEAVTISQSEEFSRYIWTPEQLRSADLDPELFPPFIGIGDRIGRVSSRASGYLGLRVGVPVCAAGHDFLISLLGTKTIVPGRTCDRAGTSEGINHCSETPVTTAQIRCLPHVVPGFYNVAGILSSTGRLFEWFRRISGQEGLPYDQMLNEIKRVAHRTQKPWFFPSIHQGAAWEFSRGMFIELGAQHGTAEMGRAVVDSIGFAVREAVEILREHGCEVRSLTACGGQAKNAVWNQMKSDIVGVPIEVPRVEDAELVGDACAALTGLGEFGSVTEASEQLVTLKQRYEPSNEVHGLYTTGYHTYRRLYSRFREALSAGDPPITRPYEP